MSKSRTTQIPTGGSGQGPMSGEASDGTMAWMSETGDWRLMGQEKFLQGVHLTRKPWWSYRPGWDHDHCAFCTVHFADHILEDDPDTQLEGWVTDDDCTWVCDACFADFREKFAWVVSASS